MSACPRPGSRTASSGGSRAAPPRWAESCSSDTIASGESGRRRSVRLQRPYVRARVRRRRLLHPSRRRVLLEVRRPAPLPCRSGRGSRSDHARGRWSAPPLRGRAHHVGRAATGSAFGRGTPRAIAPRTSSTSSSCCPRTDPRSRRVVAGGRDFYSNPRISPDGARLCFLAWNLPWMPWDGCELHVADLAPNGDLSDIEHVAGARRLRVDLAARVEPDGRPRVRERSKRLVEPRAHPR